MNTVLWATLFGIVHSTAGSIDQTTVDLSTPNVARACDPCVAIEDLSRNPPTPDGMSGSVFNLHWFTEQCKGRESVNASTGWEPAPPTTLQLNISQQQLQVTALSKRQTLELAMQDLGDLLHVCVTVYLRFEANSTSGGFKCSVMIRKRAHSFPMSSPTYAPLFWEGNLDCIGADGTLITDADLFAGMAATTMTPSPVPHRQELLEHAANAHQYALKIRDSKPPVLTAMPDVSVRHFSKTRPLSPTMQKGVGTGYLENSTTAGILMNVAAVCSGFSNVSTSCHPDMISCLRRVVVRAALSACPNLELVWVHGFTGYSIWASSRTWSPLEFSARAAGLFRCADGYISLAIHMNAGTAGAKFEIPNILPTEDPEVTYVSAVHRDFV
jgi:hypothetical protein